MNDTTKRSGFIKVKFDGDTLIVNVRKIITATLRNDRSKSVIVCVGEVKVNCDETPEQILKLIEEVEQ